MLKYSHIKIYPYLKKYFQKRFILYFAFKPRTGNKSISLSLFRFEFFLCSFIVSRISCHRSRKEGKRGDLLILCCKVTRGGIFTTKTRLRLVAFGNPGILPYLDSFRNPWFFTKKSLIDFQTIGQTFNVPITKTKDICCVC